MNYHQADRKDLGIDRNERGDKIYSKDEDSESEEIDLTTPTINQSSSPVIVNGIIDYSKGVN